MKRSIVRLLVSIASVLVVTGNALAAPALNPRDLKAILRGTEFYDDRSFGCQVTNDINLSGNDNIEKAFRFFVQQGLTAEQSAGILGNLIAESNVRPNAQQDGSKDTQPKNGVGFGIAQWTFTDRQQPLVEHAKSVGQPVDSLSPQLEYVWTELGTNRKGAGDAVKKATTVAEATKIIEELYEAPKDPAKTLPRRVRAAQQVYDNYASSVPSSTPTDPAAVTAPSNCSGIAGPGEDTQFIDGFTVYNQRDPAWNNLPYGTSTIGDSGCGPAAMAMIITALTGTRVTPPETANYAASQGMYVPGAGSKHNIGAVLAPRWGLTATPISANAAQIASTLQAGGLVITVGHGPKPFTSGGHFIVIRAVTTNGMFKVGDSGHSNTSDKEWDPQELISSMDGSVYAITK